MAASGIDRLHFRRGHGAGPPPRGYSAVSGRVRLAVTDQRGMQSAIAAAVTTNRRRAVHIGDETNRAFVMRDMNNAVDCETGSYAFLDRRGCPSLTLRATAAAATAFPQGVAAVVLLPSASEAASLGSTVDHRTPTRKRRSFGEACRHSRSIQRRPFRTSSPTRSRHLAIGGSDFGRMLGLKVVSG